MKTEMTWFRFYGSALNDEKVQTLEPTIFKGWVNLLCLASETDGIFPSVDGIAFKLRLSAQSARELVDTLILSGLIDIRPDGRMEPHNWSVRQFKSDKSAERMRKYRERKKKTSSDGSSDVTVTPDVTPPEQSRAETEQRQNRTDSEKAAAAFSYSDALEKIWQIVGFAMTRNDQGDHWLRKWREQDGADFEADVYPTLRTKAKTLKSETVDHYGYFNGAICEAIADRKAGRTNRHGVGDWTPQTAEQWLRRKLAEGGDCGVKEILQ